MIVMLRCLKKMIILPQSKIVPLWWPRGYGEQNLFTLNVTFETFKGPYRSATDKSSKSLRIGFRTVELIQEPVKNKFQIRKGDFSKRQCLETGRDFLPSVKQRAELGNNFPYPYIILVLVRLKQFL